MVDKEHYVIENIDATIIAASPKMRPYIDEMRINIAQALRISLSQVNVKATTEEGLGFTGSGEGISSQAICLLTSPMDAFSTVYGDDMQGCSRCQGCDRG
jgi:2-C-methyl-D-erythritol 2,4-cyclodiphosphate synthase